MRYTAQRVSMKLSVQLASMVKSPKLGMDRTAANPSTGRMSDALSARQIWIRLSARGGRGRERNVRERSSRAS